VGISTPSVFLVFSDLEAKLFKNNRHERKNIFTRGTTLRLTSAEIVAVTTTMSTTITPNKGDILDLFERERCPAFGVSKTTRAVLEGRAGGFFVASVSGKAICLFGRCCHGYWLFHRRRNFVDRFGNDRFLAHGWSVCVCLVFLLGDAALDGSNSKGQSETPPLTFSLISRHFL
jgi:hypothetical protein